MQSYQLFISSDISSIWVYAVQCKWEKNFSLILIKCIANIVYSTTLEQVACVIADVDILANEGRRFDDAIQATRNSMLVVAD